MLDADDIGYSLTKLFTNLGLLGSLSVVSRGSTVRHPVNYIFFAFNLVVYTGNLTEMNIRIRKYWTGRVYTNQEVNFQLK